MKIKVPNKELTGLPGWELVSRGLEDISKGKYDTTHALLLFMACQRLNDLGIEIQAYPGIATNEAVHLKFYHSLQPKHGNDAHSQYNALQDRLFSFCTSLEALTK